MDHTKELSPAKASLAPLGPEWTRPGAANRSSVAPVVALPRPARQPLFPAGVSRSIQFLTLVLGAAVITWLDYATGPNQDFGFFYSVIIILGCVQFGMVGLVFVPICFAGYLINAVIFHGLEGYVFRPGNALVRAWSFIAVGLVSSLLNRARQSAEEKQRALEASSSERDAFFQCLPDAVLLLDPDLRVRALGGPSEHLLGLLGVAARGARLADLPVDPVLKEYFRRFTEQPGLNSSSHLEVKSPRELRLLAVSAPIRTERQAFLGWVMALRDVTELVRSQEMHLSRARSLAVQETRTQLARHLHDNVAQTLAALRMRLDLLAAGLDDAEERERLVRTVQRALGQAIRDLRQTMWELRPTALERLPFVQALEAHLAELQENAGYDVRLEVQGPVRLAPEREVLLFYLIQEAVANALKYSQSEEVAVTLQGEEGGGLRVEVRDQGVGFDVEAVANDPMRKSYGLQDMKDRARVMGAELSIHSAPGQGTRLCVSVPPDQEMEEQDHG